MYIGFGSILGYALVMAYIQMGMDMLYSFPWIPILVYIVAIFAVQYILVYYGIKLLQKESIVERMKNERSDRKKSFYQMVMILRVLLLMKYFLQVIRYSSIVYLKKN